MSDFFISEVIKGDVSLSKHFDLDEWAVPKYLCESVVRIVKYELVYYFADVFWIPHSTPPLFSIIALTSERR